MISFSLWFLSGGAWDSSHKPRCKGKKLVLALLYAMGITTGALLSLGGCATGSPEEREKILKATAQWEQEMKEQKERQEELKRRGF